jgi:hypothetical protein
MVVTRSNGTQDTRYFHSDHLGPISLITTSAGGSYETLRYDAFGKRRQSNSSDDPYNTVFAPRPIAASLLTSIWMRSRSST